MPFDFKKEYKEFYLPKNQPGIVTVPPINYLAVRGQGNPNDETGEYKAALEILYALAYTLKMSYKGTHKIEGFSSISLRHVKGFGSRGKASGKAGSIMRKKRISALFRSSVCRIL